MIYPYLCQLTPDEDGGLVATFPDVPEAITGGRDRSEALAMAEDALATALAGYVYEKWDIPALSEAADGQVSVPVPTVAGADRRRRQTRPVLGYEGAAHHQSGACRQAGHQRVGRTKAGQS